MTQPDDDFTELVDADIPRVDLVDKAANGLRFILAKRADGPAPGLLAPELVRDLVTKADADPTRPEQVTVTGTPGAIAALLRPVTKETGMADTDLDASEVLAEAEVDAPGMDTTPGSPAWEAVDAATARKWTSILARAKAAVELLADRELLEAAAGEGDDCEQVMDLQDACCAIDYAIGVLAPFAVAEQAEAEYPDDMTAVGKALADWDTQALDTIEALGQVRKAGRVLSSANESAIRGAVESLQKVLASLPEAPVAPVEKSGRSVADTKETEMPQTDTDPVAKADPEAPSAEPVTKADDVKPQMRAVYDAKGRLVGVVDPEDITPIADAQPDSDEPAPADAEPEPAAAPVDTTPAPPAEVGTPADAADITKTTEDTDTGEVLKGIAAAVAKEHVDAYSATQEQVIAKQAADLAQMAEAIEVLKGQVKALEEQPAAPKVFTNGATPPANQLRGQDRGATPVDRGAAADLRKGLYSHDAGEQNRTAQAMQELAVAELANIHAGRR